MATMQFGVFSVGDVTTDPTTGRDAHRARADRGDGRASRSRPRRSASTCSRPASTTTRRSCRRPPRRCSATSPRRRRRLHPVDRDDADHDERPGEDRRGLRDAPAPRRRPGRPDDGPRQHRPGLSVVRPGHPQRHRRSPIENYALLHRLWREDVVDWEGRFRTPLTGLHVRRPGRSTASRRSSGTARSAARRSPSRPPTTATASSTTTSSGRRTTSGGWSPCTAGASSTTATARPTTRSSGSAARSSCGRTRRTRSASSGRTSTTRRSTAAARRSRTTWPRRR